jgi:hypothetical protein
MKRFTIAMLAALALSAPSGASAGITMDQLPQRGDLIYCQLPDGTFKVCQADSAGNMQISGSITASLAGFTPNGAVANLAATTSSASVALPSGAVQAVSNTGSVAVSIKLSVGAGTAATTDFQIQPGATVGLTVGSNTYINAITASGSSSLSIAGGVGLVTGYGGGGPGGGSSGAVTNAGTFAVQNTAATPAGTNVIGKVSAVDSGGTDATDTTNHAIKVNVVAASGVAQGSATSGQTVSPVGCRTVSTTPTDTAAQTNIPVCNVRGNQVVSPYALPDVLVRGTTAAMTGTTSTLLLAAPGSGLFNYITQISCVNSHATVGTFVTVQDGSGGTALMTLAAAALFGGDNRTFPAPWKQTTANTGLYVVDVTTGANVICTASGYKAP